MSGFKFKETMPEAYRAFADGELSVCMEHGGGIDEIALVDGPEWNHVIYPDPFPHKLLSRSLGESQKRPLFGSAVRLLSEDGDGKVVPHTPDAPEIFPWGIRSGKGDAGLSMFLDRKTILLEASATKMIWQNLVLGKCHFNVRENLSLPNIWNDDFNRPYHDFLGDYHADEPFANGFYRPEWDAPVFDPVENVVVFKITVHQSYGDKVWYWAIAADTGFEMEEYGDFFIFRAAWQGRKRIHWALSFGESVAGAAKLARTGANEFRRIVSHKLASLKVLDRKIPAVKIEGMPLVHEFMNASAGYQNALLLTDSIGVRAASHKYGYYAMWDAIYPIRDFLWFGQYREARRMLAFVARFPHIGVSPFAVSQIISAFNELRGITDSLKYRDEMAPLLIGLFQTASRFVDDDSGLVMTLNACGVDSPRELGLDGFFYAGCINGWWYNACRVMENLGIELGDQELTQKAGNNAALLEQNFHSVFFNESAGFIRTAVKRDFQPSTPEIFHNSGSIGFDYLYGQYLLRHEAERMTDYFACRLHHYWGHSAVAFDSPVPCEMWKSVHMNQHIGHECKLFRQGGNVEEAYRTVAAYLKVFDRYKTAVETFNFTGCLGNESQNADFQSFSCAAVNEAIRVGLAGIVRDRGGLRYLPGGDHRKIEIAGLHQDTGKMNILITGSGAWGELFLDDKLVKGSMQIPKDRAGQNLTIRRRKISPVYPVLLHAADMRIGKLAVSKKELRFEIFDRRHAPLKIYSPMRPRLEINDQAVEFEWDDAKLTLYCDRLYSIGDKVAVIIPE